MAKGYWVALVNVKNKEEYQKYADLAGPAINLHGGKFWRSPGYIGFRSADHLHRVDLETDKETMTLFIPGPFGFRKTKRADYKKKF